MPRPRHKSSYGADVIATLISRGTRSIPLEERTRCDACNAYLASDNQAGVSNTGLCSSCYVKRDRVDTDRLRTVMAGTNPIEAYKLVYGEAPNGLATSNNTCRHGHEMTRANTYARKDGRTECRECRAARKAAA